MFDDTTVTLIDTHDTETADYFFTHKGASEKINALVGAGVKFTITQVPFETFVGMLLPAAPQARAMLTKAQDYPLRKTMLGMNDYDMCGALAGTLCAKEMQKYDETP